MAALLAAPDTTVALVFGNERFGLPNEVVERCHVVTHIPANPAYASLNLSQAVQLIAYEVRMALLAGTGTGDTRMEGVGFVGEGAYQISVCHVVRHFLPHCGAVWTKNTIQTQLDSLSQMSQIQ